MGYCRVHALILGALVKLVGSKSSGCGAWLPAVTQGRLSRNNHVAVHDVYNHFGYRRYSLYVPSSYKQETPVPLVLDLHGFCDSAQHEAKEDGITLVAEEEGFIMVFPNGGSNQAGDMSSNRSHWWSEWNGGGMNGSVAGAFGKDICSSNHYAYDCYQSCADAGVCKAGTRRSDDCGCSGCADDVGFIATLLEKIKSDFCIDEERIHGTGFSSGAIMLYYLATVPEIGSQFASIVPVAGSFLLGFLETPRASLPLLDIHGVRDDTVPANVSSSYRGKTCPVKGLREDGCTVSCDGFYYHTMEEILNRWSVVNKCDTPSVVEALETQFDGRTGWSCVLPHGAKCDAEIRSCTHDLGHAWPFHEGIDRIRTPDFGRAVWDFMRDKRNKYTVSHV